MIFKVTNERSKQIQHSSQRMHSEKYTQTPDNIHFFNVFFSVFVRY